MQKLLFVYQLQLNEIKDYFYEKSKRVQFIMSLETVLITLGSLTDLYSVWKDSDYIQKHNLYSSDYNLLVIILLVIILAVFLINKHILRPKKSSIKLR